jgi:hypothetical protein
MKNKYKYYFPIDIKMVFNNEKKRWNMVRSYRRYKHDKYIFLIKFSRVEYKNKYLNFGDIYHTSSKYIKTFSELKIAHSPDTINSIKIEFMSNSIPLIINDNLINMLELNLNLTTNSLIYNTNSNPLMIESDKILDEKILKTNYEICSNIKFINSILLHSSTESKMEILLYYYLQQFLLINDEIKQVEIEIDNTYYLINYKLTLAEIYKYLEDKLDEKII